MLPLKYIHQKYLSNLEKYCEFIKSCVFSTSHGYVVRIATFFQCVKCIGIWITFLMEALQERNKKTKRASKKEKEKKWSNLCAIY